METENRSRIFFALEPLEFARGVTGVFRYFRVGADGVWLESAGTSLLPKDADGLAGELDSGMWQAEQEVRRSPAEDLPWP